MKENKLKMITDIVIALLLSGSIILSCYIGVNGLADYKRAKDDINLRGWAKQQITSDLIVWTGYFDVQDENLKNGFSRLETDKEKVKKYLVEKGLKDVDLVFSSVSVHENYVVNELGTVTNEIDGYDLSQTVTINSGEIDKVTKISRSATDLINEGVQFQSYAPEYQYTKLDDLKVTMLADAAKDAKNRAEMIAENAGSKLGKLSHAHISNIKISPQYSIPNDDYYYYDYNSNDKATVSLEKEVTVSVYCTFEIK